MFSLRFTRMVRLLILALALLVTAACGTSTGASRPTPVLSPVMPTPSCTPTPSATPTPTEIPAPTATPRPAPTPLPTQPSEVPPAPVPQGKVVLVSLDHQWLYAYQDGRYVFDNAVETGMPDLATPTGHFSILTKQRDVTFISPWPEGSPYWYAPTKVSYAMLFRSGGYYLHDAWWHVVFGPGANVPHQLPDGRWETGSHGCVGMPVPDVARLYSWVQLGTLVIIVD